MNDVIRQVASEALEKEPDLAKTIGDFEAAQEEFERLMGLIGFRHIAIEMPAAGNAEAILHASVSDTGR